VKKIAFPPRFSAKDPGARKKVLRDFSRVNTKYIQHLVTARFNERKGAPTHYIQLLYNTSASINDGSW
jgi:hypothetical protein